MYKIILILVHRVRNAVKEYGPSRVYSEYQVVKHRKSLRWHFLFGSYWWKQTCERIQKVETDLQYAEVIERSRPSELKGPHPEGYGANRFCAYCPTSVFPNCNTL